MLFRRVCIVLGLLVLISFAQSGHAQVSKGNQILINRGLQLQGLSQDDVYLHLDTFTNANYTSINWINSITPAHSSRPPWMGDPPGFLCARWVTDETQMPPQITPYGGDEAPYVSQLMALQLGDEWNLNDDATRTRLVNWFNTVRANWPNVILYHNNWGNIAGATTDTLALSNVTKPDAAPYTVVITNAAGSVTSAPATLTILSPLPWREPFAYLPGDVLGGKITPDSRTWADVGAGTVGLYITNQPGNLTVPELAAPFGSSIRFDGLGKSARLSFPSPFTTGTLYYSFALKVLDLTGASASGGFIAGFNNSTGTQANQPTAVGTRLYLRTAGGGFNLGVAKDSSTSTDWVWDSTVFNINQTIFVVGSYTFGAIAVAKLWINPNPTNFGAAAPPPATLVATTGTDINSRQIASFVFFQRSAIVEPAAMI
jgi:hypothetical protein